MSLSIFVYVFLSCKSNDSFDFSQPKTDTEIFYNYECPDTFEKPDIPYQTLTQMTTPHGGWITQINQHPNNEELIWVGSPMNGLYYSTDGANSFDTTNAPQPHVTSAISLHPTNTDWVAYSNDMLNYSENRGASWKTYQKFPNHDVMPLGTKMVQALHWHHDNFFIGIGDMEEIELELYQTTSMDEEAKLVYTYQKNPAPPHSDHGDQYSFAHMSYEMNLHSNSDSLFLTIQNEVLLRSDDGGSTFTEIFSSDDYDGHVQTKSLAIDHKSNTSHLALSTYDSNTEEIFVFLSTDNGDSWNYQSKLSGTFYSISLYDKNIVIVTQDGVHYWDSTSQEWSQEDSETFSNEPLIGQYLTDGTIMIGDIRGVSLYQNASWNDVYNDFINDDISVLGGISECSGLLFAGTQCEMGGFVSYDWGQSWELIDQYFHYMMRYEERPSVSGEIWAISDTQVYKSFDYGRSWTKMLPKTLEYHFHGLGLSPFDDSHVLIGSVGSGESADSSGNVYRSTNGGNSWQKSSEGLPQNSNSIHEIHYVHDETYKNVVLLGSYHGDHSHTSTNDAFGLYRSIDDGQSWNEVFIDENIKNIPDICECNGSIFIGTDIGIYASTDGGENWNALTNDIEDSNKNVIALECIEDHVVFTTSSFVYHSADQGNSWDVLSEVPRGDETIVQGDIYFDAHMQMLWITFKNIGIFAMPL